MIVVGILGAPGGGGELAVEIAGAAAASGARVEMLGVAAADEAGDAELVRLAASGIGHATVVRSSADAIEPADLDLALNYLPEIRCIVLVRPAATLIAAAIPAAAWSNATLVLVGPLDPALAPELEAAGRGAIVIDPGPSDPEGAFARSIAAIALDQETGERAGEAHRTAAAGVADRTEGTSAEPAR